MRSRTSTALVLACLCVLGGAQDDGGYGELSVKQEFLSDDVFATTFAPALFGPSVADGMEGRLEVSFPLDACGPVSPAQGMNSYALIKRGGASTCTFVDKVLRVQAAGFQSAIVYNNVNNGNIVNMNSVNDTLTDQVNISSVFVTMEAGMRLESYANNSRPWVTLSMPYTDDSLIPYIIAMIVLLSIFVVLAVIFLVSRWCMEICRRRRSRLPKSALKKIPTKKYEKGDSYDCCAVCLDDYDEGDRLRILPCSHAFHQKCIDPWLIKSKRVCPVCKGKVFLDENRHRRREAYGDADMTESSEDEEDVQQTTNETTPLLPRRTPLGHQRAPVSPGLPESATGSTSPAVVCDSPLSELTARSASDNGQAGDDMEADLTASTGPSHARSGGNPCSVDAQVFVRDPQPREEVSVSGTTMPFVSGPLTVDCERDGGRRTERSERRLAEEGPIESPHQLV